MSVKRLLVALEPSHRLEKSIKESIEQTCDDAQESSLAIHTLQSHFKITKIPVIVRSRLRSDSSP